MRLQICVISEKDDLLQAFQKHIPAALAGLEGACPESKLPEGTNLAFVDGRLTHEALLSVLERLRAAAVYAVLVDEEKNIGDEVPQLLAEGLVDDLLLKPIRALEVLGKIKHVIHLERVKEVAVVNADLKTLIEKFEEDIRTARAIQRSLIPEKFTAVPGLKVCHKYLSGLKSGGDYLDFFEFDDKTHVGLLMSDSTGYGMSSAFMSVILKLAVKFSREEFRSPANTITKIFEELQLTMKAKENFSILYGILNRKTLELTYAGCGAVRLVHQGDKGFSELTPGGLALVKDNKISALRDRKASLLPGDRVVLFSDGFGETFEDEGRKGLERVFERVREDDAIALVNELTFRVRKRLEAEDDMPEQDCSVLVLDVEKRAMRLAK